MSILRSVQKFGQLRIPKSIVGDYGSFLTLRLHDGGILVSPAMPNDKDSPTSQICKLYVDTGNLFSFSIPIKLRRASGIENAVSIEPLENGSFLMRAAKKVNP